MNQENNRVILHSEIENINQGILEILQKQREQQQQQELEQKFQSLPVENIVQGETENKVQNRNDEVIEQYVSDDQNVSKFH